VAPDAGRRLLTKQEIVEEHFRTAGLPVGHGFTPENRARGTAYYTFDKGLCRFVVLDTVNPNGYADGSIDQAQLDWLKATLAASADRLVMVFSHHTSETMTNPLVGTGADAVIRDATELTAQVPAWLQADHDALTAKVLRRPERREITTPVQEQLIVELYSK
jgi:ribosomal protein S4